MTLRQRFNELSRDVLESGSDLPVLDDQADENRSLALIVIELIIHFRSCRPVAMVNQLPQMQCSRLICRRGEDGESYADSM